MCTQNIFSYHFTGIFQAVNRMGLTAVTVSRVVVVDTSSSMTVVFISGSKQNGTDSSDSV